MLIPQFSIRHLFGIVAAFAVLFFVASLAVRGHFVWAVALFVGLASIVLVFGLFALVFLGGWFLSRLSKTRDDLPNLVGSPFAEDRPAPQILPPDAAP